MRNIFAIIKKEFFRFFKDTRLMFTTVILPGLMIFLVYSVIGTALTDQFGGDSEYVHKVYVNEIPESINYLIENSGITIEKIEYKDEDVEFVKEKIAKKEADILVIFSPDFDNSVNSYEIGNGEAPYIKMYYNSISTESGIIYNTLSTLFNAYESQISNKFDINLGEEKFDLASDKDLTGTIFSMMLPFLILTFLFSGCMAIAPESIAGEKERGTIATLLVTPIKRSELAIGKIISLSVIAILSALSSFLGTIASLPKLMGMQDGQISSNVYSMGDYFYILLIIVSTVMVIISVMAILSSLAKSVKEASTLISPLMVLVMIVGVTSMFGSSETSLLMYFVPIYNSVKIMGAIFSFNLNTLYVLITVLSNIIYSIILVYALTKVFNNEKIMFSK